MFRRYDRSIIKAVIVGLLGAVVVCGVSDVVFPLCLASRGRDPAGR